MILGERNRRGGVPVLNTSSLPDLIFTVLFFFMVVTHMRKVTLKVRYRVPQGTELTRLTKKSAVSYVYIGKLPSDGAQSAREHLQLNDKIATPADVADYMAAERQRMSANDRVRMTVSIKADRNTPMGLLTDVKQSLRQAGVRRISLSAEQRK